MRGDLLDAGLVAPTAILLAMRPLAHRGNVRLALGIGVPVQILRFVELMGFWEVGAFLLL